MSIINGTQAGQAGLAQITSSSPADSVLSGVASLLTNLNGWSLALTAILAVIIYDQGTSSRRVANV